MSITLKTIISRVTKYGRKPKTPLQVLEQAHALLQEEGRWVKNDFFRDGDPKEAYENAACGSWGVCALGALGIVSGEMPVAVERCSATVDRGDWIEAVEYGSYDLGLNEFLANPPEGFGDEYEWAPTANITPTDTPLAYRAAEYLAQEIVKFPGVYYTYDPFGVEAANDDAAYVVFNWNDHYNRKRSQVLRAFNKAIKAAKGDPIAKARKRNS